MEVLFPRQPQQLKPPKQPPSAGSTRAAAQPPPVSSSRAAAQPHALRTQICPLIIRQHECMHQMCVSNFACKAQR